MKRSRIKSAIAVTSSNFKKINKRVKTSFSTSDFIRFEPKNMQSIDA